VTGSAEPAATYERLADNALGAARRLFEFLADHHWTGHALVGPNSGARFNYRAGRFTKNYLRRFPWRDELCYLQGQGYWILTRLRVQEATSPSPVEAGGSNA
jgi:hypothetical protein